MTTGRSIVRRPISEAVGCIRRFSVMQASRCSKVFLLLTVLLHGILSRASRTGSEGSSFCLTRGFLASSRKRQEIVPTLRRQCNFLLKALSIPPTACGLGASEERLGHLIDNVLIRHGLSGVWSIAVVKHMLEQVYPFHIFRLRLPLLYDFGDGLIEATRLSHLRSTHNGRQADLVPLSWKKANRISTRCPVF
jgi:hypothetical protein